MSIMADIKQARAEYEDHNARHKCSSLEPCEKRTEKWQAWMLTAELWGQEPDDQQRQRDHHFRNIKNAPATTEAEAA